MHHEGTERTRGDDGQSGDDPSGGVDRSSGDDRPRGTDRPTRTEPAGPAVHLQDVHFSYDRRPVLVGVTLRVEPGTFTAVIGPNGAGKSTCLKLLLGLLVPDRGRVTLFGHQPGEHREPIGYVPQKAGIPSGFPLSTAEVVIMGRYGLLGSGRRPASADRRRVVEALGEVGLAAQEHDRFGELSGGQQQRALIARALAGDPRLLLLDEPTAGLDPAARARFYALVCDLQKARGLTVISASHDIEDVAAHADQLILLDHEVRAAGPPSDVLASPVLARTYAFPRPHEHAEERAPDRGRGRGHREPTGHPGRPGHRGHPDRPDRHDRPPGKK